MEERRDFSSSNMASSQTRELWYTHWAHALSCCPGERRVQKAAIWPSPVPLCFTLPVQLIKIRCVKILKELSHLAVFPCGSFRSTFCRHVTIKIIWRPHLYYLSLTMAHLEALSINIIMYRTVINELHHKAVKTQACGASSYDFSLQNHWEECRPVQKAQN